MIEKSLVLLKPDAVQRGLVGEIITRFEKAGLKIAGMKMVWISKELAGRHYPETLIPIMGKKTLADWDEMGVETKLSAEELGTQARNDLINFATEAPVVALVLEGVHAVAMIRKMVGHTSPHKAEPGTIRGDYSTISMGYATKRGFGGRNLIHASGSVEEAKTEVNAWFSPEELHDYKHVHHTHVQ
jgi:nucleoside-diphosphate kinase